MPGKRAGGTGGSNKVTFTKVSAQRIADAVRTVEQGNRDSGPFVGSPRISQSQPKVFRICTFTGSWQIGTLKTVTLKFKTTTPNTVAAMNLFWPLDEDDPNPRDCSIAKEGTEWYLLVPQLFRADFFTAATTVDCGIKFETLPGIALASHSTNTFTMNVETVQVVTAATVTATGLSLERLSIGVLCKNTAASTAIPFSTSTPVVTSVTMTDSAVEFSRVTLNHFGTLGTASTVQLSIATCATATTS